VPATFVDISDADDPRVADYRRLNDASHRRQIEAPTSFGRGFFVVEGWLATQRAIETRQAFRSVLVASTRRRRAADLLSRADVTVFVATADVIEAIVGFDLHRGIVAACDRRLPVDPAAVTARASRLVVLEGVNDAENLGVVFRNAAGLGAEGVLLDPTCCDPLARRTVRVSLGHVLSVPWARVAWPDGVDAVVRAHGHRLVALTPHSDAIDLREVEPGERTALLLGAEGPGLSSVALGAADVCARIPMNPDVDSLNLGSAAAIAMWQLFGDPESRRTGGTRGG
jgi:tRNA G18 (ribose-2'-O)-methylase SpoU